MDRSSRRKLLAHAKKIAVRDFSQDETLQNCQPLLNLQNQARMMVRCNATNVDTCIAYGVYVKQLRDVLSTMEL